MKSSASKKFSQKTLKDRKVGDRCLPKTFARFTGGQPSAVGERTWHLDCLENNDAAIDLGFQLGTLFGDGCFSHVSPRNQMVWLERGLLKHLSNHLLGQDLSHLVLFVYVFLLILVVVVIK